MQKTNYIWAICSNPYSDLDEVKDEIKKEYELTDNDLIGYEAGYLFNIIDNIRYCVLECDVVLFNEENESYYQTSNSDTMQPVATKEILLLVDENGEAERV